MKTRLQARLAETPPLILLTLALMLGIAAGLESTVTVWLAAAGAFALLAVALLPRRGLAAALVCVCALGFLRGWQTQHQPVPAEGTYTVSAIIAENVTAGSGSQQHTRLKDVQLNGEAVPGQAYWSFYGDAPTPLAAGDRVRFTGRVYAATGPENPGGFDFRAYLLQNGMAFGIYGITDCTAEAGPFDLSCTFARLRQRASALLCAQLDEDAGGYAAAMLLGERSLLDVQERRAFSRLGAAHLLAVSGFHVGVLAWVLEKLLRGLRLGRVPRFAVTCVFLAGYCLLTGGSSSVLRAALLYGLYSLGRLCQRRGDGATSLSAAAFLILLLRPAQLTAAGFQLTFGAVAGIQWFGPPLRGLCRVKGRFSRSLWESLCTTLAAQLGTLLPVMAWFQQVPLLGLFANVLLLPWATVMIYGSLLTLVLAAIPGVSAVVSGATAGVIRAMVATVEALSKLPGVYLWTHQPNVLTYAGMALLAWALGQRSWLQAKARRSLGALGAVCMAASLITLPFAGTQWLQLSVGNADAAVLRDGSVTWAVDTGSDDELALYLRQRRLSLDGLVVTHLQTDHAGGLRALLDYDIPVRTCYLPWGAERVAFNEGSAALVTELQSRGTELVYLHRGDEITLPSGSMTVLWPEEGKVRLQADPNDFCLVTKWTLHEVTQLSTADLTGTYEGYAAEPADLLKAAHHGSESSTGEAFIERVAPQAVLLSARKQEHLASMRQRAPEAAVFSTGTQGMLTVDITEGAFTITPFRAQEDDE